MEHEAVGSRYCLVYETFHPLCSSLYYTRPIWTRHRHLSAKYEPNTLLLRNPTLIHGLRAQLRSFLHQVLPEHLPKLPSAFEKLVNKLINQSPHRRCLQTRHAFNIPPVRRARQFSKDNVNCGNMMENVVMYFSTPGSLTTQLLYLPFAARYKTEQLVRFLLAVDVEIE